MLFGAGFHFVLLSPKMYLFFQGLRQSSEQSAPVLHPNYWEGAGFRV